MKYRISRKAEHDLEEIFDYIALDSPRYALETVQRIRHEFRAIAAAPLQFPLRTEIAPGARSAVVRRYVVFFRVLDDCVSIERVFHGARDIPNLLQ